MTCKNTPAAPPTLDLNAACNLVYGGQEIELWDALLPKVESLIPGVVNPIHSPEDCSLTYPGGAPDGGPLVVPLGAHPSEVDMSLTKPLVGGLQLSLQYKDKLVQVPMPDPLVDCTYNPGTNALEFFKCDGSSSLKQLNIPVLECNILPDGTQVLCFDNGAAGGKKLFNIPGVVMQMQDNDALTIAGDTLVFTFGGDGNDATVTVPLCDIIANNCNATFLEINPDGSWVFVDNAGVPHIHNAPTHESPDGSVQIIYNTDTNTYEYVVTAPVIPDPEKETFKAGQTLPETALVTEVCVVDADGNETVVTVGANSVLPDDMVGCVQVDEFDGTTAYFPPKARTTPPEVFVGESTPEKDAGFTAWFNPVTCVIKFCDNAGDWREPRNVVCQEDEPSTDKGGADLWYKPSACCFSVLCDGAWLSTGGVTASPVIPILQNLDGSFVEPALDANDRPIICNPELVTCKGIVGKLTPELEEALDTDSCVYDFLDKQGLPLKRVVNRNERQCAESASFGQLQTLRFAELSAIPLAPHLEPIDFACQEITNPSKCRDMMVVRYLRMGNVRFQAAPGTNIAYGQNSVFTSAGPPYFLAGASEIANLSGSEMEYESFGPHTEMAVNEFASIGDPSGFLPCEETMEVCFQTYVQVRSLGPDLGTTGPLINEIRPFNYVLNLFGWLC